MNFAQVLNTVQISSLSVKLQDQFIISYFTAQRVLDQVQPFIILQALAHIKINYAQIKRLVQKQILPSPFIQQFGFIHFVGILEHVFNQQDLIIKFAPNQVRKNIKRFGCSIMLVEEQKNNMIAYELFREINKYELYPKLRFEGTPNNSGIELSESF